MKSHYDVLGVKQSATTTEIKSAFRRLALLVHPDKTGTPKDDSFIELHDAYEILSNPVRRKEYDKKLAQMSSTSTGQSTNSSSSNVADDALADLNKMIQGFAKSDPTFANALAGSDLRSRIISSLLPHIKTDLFLIDQKNLITKLTSFMRETHSLLISTTKLYKLLKLIQAKKQKDLTPQEKQLLQGVTEYQADLNVTIERVRNQINELKNWELPLRLLLLDLELSNDSELLNQRGEARKLDLEKEFDRLGNLSLDEQELVLLAILLPEVEQKLSIEQWRKIRSQSCFFDTERDMDNHLQTNSNAKSQMASFIQQRFIRRYNNRIGRELYNRTLPPLKFISDRDTWASMHNQAHDIFMMDAIFQGYINAAKVDQPNESIQKIFAVTYREDVRFSGWYDDYDMDRRVVIEGMNFLWGELSKCARNSASMTFNERNSLQQVAASIIPLFSDQYCHADKLYNATCLLKTHADALMKQHHANSSLAFLSSLTAPDLLKTYNSIIKTIEKKYWKGEPIVALNSSSSVAVSSGTMSMNDSDSNKARR